MVTAEAETARQYLAALLTVTITVTMSLVSTLVLPLASLLLSPARADLVTELNQCLEQRDQPVVNCLKM